MVEPTLGARVQVAQQVDRLLDRARALLRTAPADGPRAVATRAVLGQLIRLRHSKRLDDERQEVDRLTRELSRLESED